MKKIVSLSALLAMILASMTGCGGRSQEELDSIAQDVAGAAVTALVEMDADGITPPSGVIDSEGKAGSSAELENGMLAYVENLNDVEWVVCINPDGYYVEYVCVADSYDSSKVGVSGNAPAGATLNEKLDK